MCRNRSTHPVVVKMLARVAFPAPAMRLCSKRVDVGYGRERKLDLFLERAVFLHSITISRCQTLIDLAYSARSCCGVSKHAQRWLRVFGACVAKPVRQLFEGQHRPTRQERLAKANLFASRVRPLIHELQGSGIMVKTVSRVVDSAGCQHGTGWLLDGSGS